MSRRRNKLKEIEVQHIIERPPAMRPKREVSHILRLLDQIAGKKSNEGGSTK